MATGGFRRFWITGEAGRQNTWGADYLIYDVSLYPTDGSDSNVFSLIAGPDSEPQGHQLGTYRLVYQASAVNRQPNHKHMFHGVLKNNEWLYNNSNKSAYITLVEL